MLTEVRLLAGGLLATMRLQVRWTRVVGAAVVFAGVVANSAGLLGESKAAALTTPWTEEAKAAKVPLGEYPRPQMVRKEWVNLNGDWDYMGGKLMVDPGGVPGKPPAFPAKPERIKVPFPPESYLSGIQRDQEMHMWYRRGFAVPASWRKKRVLLHFGAVANEAAVYVNGKLAATHKGAWEAFDADVTDLLKAGENELVVGAKDALDGSYSCGKSCLVHGDYTYSSGIWQTVWMEPVAGTHIERVVITPDLARSVVKVKAEVHGAGKVHFVAMADGKAVGEVSGAAGAELEIPIAHVRTWSPADPFLYDLKVSLADGGDEVGSYFGMRSVAIGMVDGKLRPLLNGKFVFQMGPLDQGYWPDGVYTAPTDAAIQNDFAIAKKAGFNLMRKHAKVEPARWYYWADKMGLLVWQDMPTMWLPDNDKERVRGQFEAEWKTIIEQHWSSPAIVAWVPFNENWGAYDVPRITAWTKGFDPTRLVDGNTGYNNDPGYRPVTGDPGNGDFGDLHIYVGPGKPPEPTATRAAALGEYGGVGLEVPGHMWPGKHHAYEMQGSVEELTKRFERIQSELRVLVETKGLGAAVYTQLTDVEAEINGLVTYDRRFEKMDFSRVRVANEAVLAAGEKVNSGK